MSFNLYTTICNCEPGSYPPTGIDASGDNLDVHVNATNSVWTPADDGTLTVSRNGQTLYSTLRDGKTVVVSDNSREALKWSLNRVSGDIHTVTLKTDPNVAPVKNYRWTLSSNTYGAEIVLQSGPDEPSEFQRFKKEDVPDA